MATAAVLALLGMFSFEEAGVFAFTAPLLPTPRHKGSKIWPSSALRSALVESEGELADDNIVPAGGAGTEPELWLDLRGTAILPRAAISHLNDDLWGSFSPASGREGIVDRVLVSEDSVGRALQPVNSEPGNISSAMKCYFVKEDDSTIRDVRDRSAVVGRLILLKDGEMTDPLPAMDIISGGAWAVIDCGSIEDEGKRGDAVTGLVDFLYAGASAAERVLVGGGDSLGVDEDVANEIGGIVFCCKSKVDLLHSGAMIQSMESEGSLTTTDSGILVRSADADDYEAKKAEDFKSAVAIPFDVNLWKTASFVFGGFEETDAMN